MTVISCIFTAKGQWIIAISHRPLVEICPFLGYNLPKSELHSCLVLSSCEDTFDAVSVSLMNITTLYLSSRTSYLKMAMFLLL
jgi:hypothetical protein